MALGAVPALAETATTESSEEVAVEQQAASEDEKDVEPRAAVENSLDVVYVSADGNDEIGDGSQESPVASLSKAVSVVRDGGTIYAMTNIEAKSLVLVSHKSITINGNGHTVTRAEGFTATNDMGRGGYQPAMIEVANESELTLVNITFDDAFRTEGTEFEIAGDSSKDNSKKVHDGIIASYGDGRSTIILGEGTTLKNFGGLSAVYITGENGEGATLIMRSGSKICDDKLGMRAGGYAAVFNHGGTFTAEQGSSIEGIDGRAIFADNGGVTTFAGTIKNITSSEKVKSPDDAGVAYYGSGNTKFTLASGGVIESINSHDNTGSDSVLHLISCTFTTEQGSEIRNISPSGIADMNGATVDLGGSISNVNAKDVLFRMRGTQGAFYLRKTGSIKECAADTAVVYLNGGKPTVEIAGTIEDVSPTVFFMSNNGSRKDGSITLTETGVITNVTGYGMRLEDPSNVTIAGTITNCSSYALQYYPKSNQSLLTIKSTATIEDNNDGGAQVRAQNTLPATDAQEHIVLEPGGLDGNTTVDLTAFDVTLDSDYENIKLGNASSSAATAIKDAVASQNADWTVVGSSAAWVQPSTSEVHFTASRSSYMKKTALFAALIPLNEDGTPVSGAEVILQEVENSDPVDVTLTGLTAGQSYAMMFVNNNEYTLAPDDVTIYTGGGQGQETSDNGFPTPTFTDSLDDIETLEIDGKEVQSDDLMGALLKLFTVTYTDAEGNPVTNDAEAGEYTMTLQWAGDEHEVRINGNDVADEFGTGVLTVRYVENIDEAIDGTNTHELLDDEPTELVEHAEAIANESPLPGLFKTEFYTNDDEDRQVAADGIQILDDDLLVDEDGTDRQYLLEQRAVDEGVLPELGEGQAYRFDFHYLDLVDAYNGNAWVSASYGTTVYLPYPDEMTYDKAKDINFTVVHYPELHREYGFSGEAEVVPAIEACVPEVVEAECTPQGIKFNVPREGFSPYAIVWQTDARTITATADEGSTVTPAGTFTVSVEEGKTFSIEAKENYAIADVTLNGVSVLDQVKDGAFTVPASEEDQELVVTSRSTLHTITATAGEGGTITPSGDVTVSEGDGQTFTITPNEGYVIADVKVDGESVGRVDSYAFDGVTEDHTIEATFEIEPAAPHEHVWSDWKCDGETHWKVCEICGAVSERAEHTFGDWEQVSGATESEKGQWVRTCTVCGYEQHGTTPVTEPDGSGMPETGDRTPTALTGVLAACGAALVAGTVIYRRRHDG